MINPLLVLSIGRVKILIYRKSSLQYFNMLDVLKQQVAVAWLAPCFGKAQHLPAHQHYVVTGCTANAVRMHHAHNRLATHGNTAGTPALRCNPQQLRYFFHDINKILITKDLTGLIRESNTDLSGLTIYKIID
jgi:hypothetical protein